MSMPSTTVSEFIRFEIMSEWTAYIEPKQLALLDVGYVVDNVLSQFQGEKRVMVIWTMRNKGIV